MGIYVGFARLHQLRFVARDPILTGILKVTQLPPLCTLKGKRSYQPLLTFIAETREYLMGGLRNGDRPTGKQVADHLASAFAALPAGVQP